MSARQPSHSPAWTAYASGDLPEARKRADAAIGADEDDGRAWEVRGLVLRDLNEPLDAADAIEHASLLVPICLEARIALAQCYGTLRRRTLARDLYLELVKSNDLSLALLLEVAAGLNAVDEPKLAMEVCRRAGWRDPEAAQVYYDMALYAARCGYRPSVVESLAWHAIDLEPENVHYRLGLASLLTRFARVTEAHRLVQSLSPQQIAALTCRGCLERMGALFEQAGDAERGAVCRKRWRELAALTSASPRSDLGLGTGCRV